MKRLTKITRYILICLIALAVGLTVTKLVQTDAEADDQLAEIDRFIEEHSVTTYSPDEEMETVSLSFDEWKKEKQKQTRITAEIQEEVEKAQLSEEGTTYENVWTLGYQLYGISELDTTRTLKLITYEGYGADSPLSYYVACCCFVRATENYWGYDNLYQAFGEIDTSYDAWMDDLEIADWAYSALEQCYLNPSYVKYCNGMTIPQDWIYSESGIYVW